MSYTKKYLVLNLFILMVASAGFTLFPVVIYSSSESQQKVNMVASFFVVLKFKVFFSVF